MRVIRFISLTALVILSLAAGIAAALRLARPTRSSSSLATPAIASIGSAHTQQSTDLFAEKSVRANMLELPTASADFVGYWGGYIHSSIERLSPALTGTSPDRVSIVFGRVGDTVFVASELYSSPSQKLVHRPKARILGPRVAIIEYESADHDLFYIYSHRFRLADASRISYQSTVDIYDLSSHRLMGVVTQTASLKRLLTVREQYQFARPSKLQIPRAEISANASLTPNR